MVKVVGQDESVAKFVTHSNCGANASTVVDK